MVDIRTDKDYKRLYEQAHIDRMKYADELTNAENILKQIKVELSNANNGLNADKTKGILSWLEDYE